MKKLIFTTILATLLALSPVAFAALTGPTGGSGLAIPASLCKISAVAWVFCGSTDTLGASTNRVDKVWLDDLDATSGTIGTLTVSSTVSGNMSVGGTLTVGQGATINNTQANSDTTIKSVNNATMIFLDASADALSIGGAGTIDASAIVDIVSTTKGVLLPRLTTVQRDAIATPATGLVLINSTTGRINTYGGVSWLVTPILSGDNDWTGVNTFENTDLHIFDTNASHDLILKPGSDITADRTLTLTTGDADRTISLSGNFTTAADLITSGANSLTLTTTGATNVTLPTSGTLYGTATGSITSANLLGSLSDETGTSLAVFSNSPTFTDDFDLATTGVRLTGLDGVLTILGLGNGADEDLTIDLDNGGANIATIASTTGVTTLNFNGIILQESAVNVLNNDEIDASAELLAIMDDETGTGALVFANTPTLVTPVLGVATATSINKVAITAPTTSATLTLADGSTLVTSGANSITLTSTGATNVTLPTTGTLATLAGTETLSAKTLTAPKLADLGFIANPSGNEMIVFDTVASSVNGLYIIDAIDNGDVRITPFPRAGSSGDIGLALDASQAGKLKLNSLDGGQVILGANSYSVGAIESATETNTNLVQFDTVSITGSGAVDFTDEGLRDYAAAPVVILSAEYNNDAVTLLQCNAHTITTTGFTIECVTIADGVTAVVAADASARTIHYTTWGAVTL